MILFLDFGSFPASFQLPETLPLEEQIADRDGPDGAYQVGQKAAGHRVTGVFNTHTAEIYGQNIEGCIGRSLQNAADRKSTRLNSSHANISYAVFCLKKKKTINS